MRDKEKRQAESGDLGIATLRRVGLTDRDRLTWLVGAVQKRLAELPPGERSDLRQALFFYMVVDLRLKPGEMNLGPPGEEIPPLTDLELRDLLAYCEGMLRAVARRQKLNAPGRGVEREHLVWDGEGRYIFWELYSTRSWKEWARVALWRQVAAYGHMVKECPAPARRGKPGEVCGLLFMAKRPNQDFCSSTCRGRAGVRDSRARKREAGGEG